ncbi:hypothetical protein Egran_02388 [Elaphomyces granulatus]|uniref:Dihydroorotate dehydrogenase (quinone), mitochondrial n=1 Tax=Elaphomyces granulatus TaxID=519963 RepID=A0A232M0J4_9EURO|nr:hypothetical protein Egran_02388 [Elaphomyces granulatus]
MPLSLRVLASRPMLINSKYPVSVCPRVRLIPSILPHRIAPLSKITLRATSTTAALSGSWMKTTKTIRRVIIRTSIALVVLGAYIYLTDTRASIHRYLVVPLIRWAYPDAEDAHHACVRVLKMLYDFGLHPRERSIPDGAGSLATEVFGYRLYNPIGIPGGLDKHAEIPDPLFDLGPAIVEVGGTTPLPQEGNLKPRVFRLPSQSAMVNRYGLNSKGADHMASVLKHRVREFAYANGFGLHEIAEKRVLNGEAGVPPGSLANGHLLAVQVAKNKVTPESDIEAVTRDYVYCVDRLAKYADILVVNVSSPNTPGLRGLQASAPLTAILQGVVTAARRTNRKTKPFVMVKVSPDEDSDEQIRGICRAVWDSGVDGVIVGNTTNRRPKPLPKGYILPSTERQALKETGGYSGPQLFDYTVPLVARYRKILDEDMVEQLPRTNSHLDSASDVAGDQTVLRRDTGAITPTTKVADESHPKKVIFASGGISNGKQALAVLDAGASVAMMYTAIVYGGVGTVTRVKKEMREEKQKDLQLNS